MHATSLIRHARRNAVGYLALFVALGGTSYAVSLPRDSVGSKQLQRGAISSSKLARNSVTSSKVADRSLKAIDFAAGQLPRGATGPAGAKGDSGAPGPAIGPAGGDLAGSFPSPEIGAGAVGPAEQGAVPAARVYRQEDYTTPESFWNVPFHQESYDTADLHSNANPSRLTAPIAGVYLVTGNVYWDQPDTNAGSSRVLEIVTNGALGQLLAIDLAGEQADTQTVVGMGRLAAGDFVELQGFEDATAPVRLIASPTGGGYPSLAMTWLGP